MKDAISSLSAKINTYQSVSCPVLNRLTSVRYKSSPYSPEKQKIACDRVLLPLKSSQSSQQCLFLFSFAQFYCRELPGAKCSVCVSRLFSVRLLLLGLSFNKPNTPTPTEHILGAPSVAKDMFILWQLLEAFLECFKKRSRHVAVSFRGSKPRHSSVTVRPYTHIPYKNWAMRNIKRVSAFIENNRISATIFLILTNFKE